MLPIQFVINDDGVSIEGDRGISTLIGTFSIGGKYDLQERDSDSIRVVIRDRDRGETGFDTVYDVKTDGGEFEAVTDGLTRIRVKDGQVLIDVTDGTVRSIELVEVTDEAGAARTAKWWQFGKKWDIGYDASFYHPFGLSQWAYDDSTIGKWFGIGFLWFLLRLAMALVLLVLDIFMTVAFLLAQVAFVLFGETGSNIAWGLAALSVPVVPLTIGAWLFRD